MEVENREERQPVAARFLSLDKYPQKPQRQIECEILFVESGNGALYFGNSVQMVQGGDFIFINSFEEHIFRQEFFLMRLRLVELMTPAEPFLKA